uniref:B-cell translocation gene 3 n=1 Tax=Gouania willdenowi TaxID=441366 RepID=A0A8C5ELN8_GOUWI
HVFDVYHNIHFYYFTYKVRLNEIKCMMRTEIAALIIFLKRLVKMRNKVDVEKISLFAERLAVAHQEMFKGHWFSENPSKGQAYMNKFHRYDPELLRACRKSGVQYRDLGLPRELTLWVDPGELCGRGVTKTQTPILHSIFLDFLIICDCGIHVLNRKMQSKPFSFFLL